VTRGLIKSTAHVYMSSLKITLQFVFIVRLGLVLMGRYKCEAVACLSSQVKCNFYELFIVHFIYGV